MVRAPTVTPADHYRMYATIAAELAAETSDLGPSGVTAWNGSSLASTRG